MDSKAKSKSPRRKTKKLNINDLPTELLVQIFSFLEVIECIRIKTVCKRWNEIVATNPQQPTFLSSKDFPQTLTYSIFNSILKQCGSSLECLDLRYLPCQLPSEALDGIAQYCPNLTTITFAKVSVTKEKLKDVFTSCTKLKNLIFFGMYSEDEMKVALSGCANLESLHIQDNQDIKGQCFTLLNQNLKKLNLTNCHFVHHSGFEGLAYCTGLEELTLHNNCDLSLHSFRFIFVRFHRTIRKLQITSQFVNADYNQLPFNLFGKLEELGLSYTRYLTDEFMEGILSKCPNVWKLDLSSTQISLPTLRLLTRHPKIVDINISHFRNNANNELVALAMCGYLEAFTLCSSNWLTNGTCVALAQHCKNLRYLDVSNCRRITNHMITAVQQLERSVKLTIIAGGTKVTNFITSTNLVVKNVNLATPPTIMIPIHLPPGLDLQSFFNFRIQNPSS